MSTRVSAGDDASYLLDGDSAVGTATNVIALVSLRAADLGRRRLRERFPFLRRAVSDLIPARRLGLESGEWILTGPIELKKQKTKIPEVFA